MSKFHDDSTYASNPGGVRRLLTVNTYARASHVSADLVPGPGDLGQRQNFFPLIAELLSDDEASVQLRKAAIDEAEWQRCHELGSAYLRLNPGRSRDGSPFASWKPAD